MTDEVDELSGQEVPAGPCPECGAVIDVTKSGHGHRADPICGGFVFEVNPDVIESLKTQPLNATSRELTLAWLKKLGVGYGPGTEGS